MIGHPKLELGVRICSHLGLRKTFPYIYIYIIHMIQYQNFKFHVIKVSLHNQIKISYCYASIYKVK